MVRIAALQTEKLVEESGELLRDGVAAVRSISGNVVWSFRTAAKGGGAILGTVLVWKCWKGDHPPSHSKASVTDS